MNDCYTVRDLIAELQRLNQDAFTNVHEIRVTGGNLGSVQLVITIDEAHVTRLVPPAIYTTYGTRLSDDATLNAIRTLQDGFQSQARMNEVLVAAQSIRELSAEVNEAKKDYALLELKANEYEDDRDRNAELWEAMKAERDRLAGLAQEAIDWGLNGDKGYDLLRATATKSALKAALAQAGQTGGTVG